MTLPTNQFPEIRTHLRTSLEQRAFGVAYGYDLALTVAQVQTPQGPRMMPVYMLLITRPSPLLGGPPLSHLAQVPHARPTFELVDEQVGDGLRKLAALHAELKRPPAAPPASQAIASANGRRR